MSKMSKSFHNRCYSTIHDITQASRPGIHLHPLTRTMTCQLALADFTKTPSLCHKPYLVGPALVAGSMDGLIAPETRLVVPSSGNTASTLALFGQELGLPVTAFMPAGTSAAKVQRCRDAGAEVSFATATGGQSVLEATEAAASAFVDASNGQAYLLDQFGPPPFAHDLKVSFGGVTREACLRSLGRAPNAWVGGVGTGDSLMSMRRTSVLHDEEAIVVLADVPGGLYTRTNTPAAKGGIEGLNPYFVPGAFHRGAPTKVMTASVEEAKAAVIDLQDLTGLHAGPSSGLVVAVALKLCEEMTRAGRDALVVAPLYDSGTLYL